MNRHERRTKKAQTLDRQRRAKRDELTVREKGQADREHEAQVVAVQCPDQLAEDLGAGAIDYAGHLYRVALCVDAFRLGLEPALDGQGRSLGHERPLWWTVWEFLDLSRTTTPASHWRPGDRALVPHDLPRIEGAPAGAIETPAEIFEISTAGPVDLRPGDLSRALDQTAHPSTAQEREEAARNPEETIEIPSIRPVRQIAKEALDRMGVDPRALAKARAILEARR